MQKGFFKVGVDKILFLYTKLLMELAIGVAKKHQDAYTFTVPMHICTYNYIPGFKLKSHLPHLQRGGDYNAG